MKYVLSNIIVAFSKKCPKCSKKGLFRNYLDMEKACRFCKLNLTAPHEGFAGSIVINYSVSIIITALYMIFAFRLDAMGDTALTLSAAGVAMGSIIFFHPFAKTYWLHLQYNSGSLKEAEKNNRLR